MNEGEDLDKEDRVQCKAWRELLWLPPWRLVLNWVVEGPGAAVEEPTFTLLSMMKSCARTDPLSKVHGTLLHCLDF